MQAQWEIGKVWSIYERGTGAPGNWLPVFSVTACHGGALFAGPFRSDCGLGGHTARPAPPVDIERKQRRNAIEAVHD